MKKILSFCLLALSLASCYDDKGGNDYDTALPDVEILIPENAYGAALGEVITITPTVNTEIPEDDLEFIWEVNGNKTNEFNHKAYLPLLAEEEQGKVLNYTAHIDENITTLNLPYTCRLHAHQKSTGRDFYSKNTCTITISGKSGLMLLYGDNNGSDIGIFQSNDFMPQSMTVPAEDNASTQLFSMSNGGKLMEGKGIEIQQITSLYFTTYMAYYPDLLGPRCGQIYARTDKGASFINKDGFDALGDWNYFFYIKGEDAVNKNQPKGLLVYMIYVFGFDGGDAFSYNGLSSFPFLFAETTPETTLTQDGNKVSFSGQSCLINGGSGRPYPGLLYADAINGDKNRKGFLAFNPNPGSMASWSRVIDTKGDNVIFNPGNTHADLIKMRCDSRNHVMAVMKGDASHPTMVGKYFVIDMNTAAATIAGSSTAYSGIPQFMYDMSGMPGISQASAFEFGATQNMCYYASGSNVYHYRLDGSLASTADPLTMMDGGAWSPQGEVTMMKFLDNDAMTTPTHTTDKVLMVGVWQDGKAALWSLHIDLASGRIKSAKKYDASNVKGWNFDKPILDAAVKNM